MKTCEIEGCTRPHKSRGMCDTHYAYFRRTGIVGGQRQNKTLAERLWRRVDKSPGQGPNGDCWEWRGYVHPTGYGQLGFDTKPGNNINTNRAAYIVSKGEIPEGLWVLHTCDNRLCCNPDHLWLGTPKENTQDMIAKGRRRSKDAVVKGEDVTNAKLTEELVRQMRAEPFMRLADLAAKYGVSKATANKVLLRQTWKHVD